MAEDFGFDLSSITRAFYRQIVREQRIPLNLSYPPPQYGIASSATRSGRIPSLGHIGTVQIR
ncbi:hypothetical protein J5O04_06945 [Corynebacterium hindlerae]|uniref:hypothetical protein n=1 Tax=Corynebacterium hindlerae TaxID=699041 RepID=UPI001AD70852|nr:hypothetical protein J5O04_06945 [Corynebacterium hindlerae]